MKPHFMAGKRAFEYIETARIEGYSNEQKN
jgi:hypothetical protein